MMAKMIPIASLAEACSMFWTIRHEADFVARSHFFVVLVDDLSDVGGDAAQGLALDVGVHIEDGLHVVMVVTSTVLRLWTEARLLSSCASFVKGVDTGVRRNSAMLLTLYLGVWTVIRYGIPALRSSQKLGATWPLRAHRDERVVRDVPLRQALLAGLASCRHSRGSRAARPPGRGARPPRRSPARCGSRRLRASSWSRGVVAIGPTTCTSMGARAGRS